MINKTRRPVTLMIRLTDEEKERIVHAAERTGMTMSALTRHSMLNTIARFDRIGELL